MKYLNCKMRAFLNQRKLGYPLTNTCNKVQNFKDIRTLQRDKHYIKGIQVSNKEEG